MAISITKKTSTHNTSASTGRSIEYIVIHYTAGVKSTSGQAASVANYFATTTVQASADYIVDDATIVQYNPDPANRYCWAVGGSKQSTKGGSLYGATKNVNSVSIEICSTNSTGKVKDANDSTWSLSSAAVAKAVELTKYLMDKYGIDADHVIRHYDVNGKLCPGVVGWNKDSGSEAKWTAFKAQLGTTAASSATSTTIYRVRKSWADASSQIGAYSSLANAKAKADANSGYYVFDESGNAIYPTSSSSSSTSSAVPYSVKVTSAKLNIRKGPGTGYASVGYTGTGTFTIVEESAGTGSTKGWGLLKSYQSGRNGWISLDYCTKI
ncbi:MAG: N-acetylmuramoyl-L-alanine amidase [Lachnospiraceae bacterium]|nr:N-acetylmuramoyl-L-alanine amidase [Lachnospiraceae bacterium]